MNQIANHPSQTPSANQSFAGVHAPLKFIRRQASKPVYLSAALTGAAAKPLFETDDFTVPIADMRAIAGNLSVDREGFEFHRHTTAVADLYDDDAIAGAYHAEIEFLLKNRLGASRVFIFDTTRRSSDGLATNPDGARGPASRIHVDYTTNSGPGRLRDVVGEAEAARLAAAGTRVAQINVWRPIRGPVERSPLALADASSIKPEDLIATDQVFPNRVGEIYHLAHESGQRWYYAPWMTADEVLLIKGWDSLDDGRARFTPHGAFEQPDTPSNAAPRESIEVRTLAIIEG